MRATHCCPKCKHEKVLHVPDPKDTDYDRMAIGGVRSVWSGEAHGAMEVYMCMRCGFVELYVKNPDQLDLTKLGATVLTAEPRGPYR